MKALTFSLLVWKRAAIHRFYISFNHQCQSHLYWSWSSHCMCSNLFTLKYSLYSLPDINSRVCAILLPTLYDEMTWSLLYTVTGGDCTNCSSLIILNKTGCPGNLLLRYVSESGFKKCIELEYLIKRVPRPTSLRTGDGSDIVLSRCLEPVLVQRGLLGSDLLSLLIIS